MDDDLPSGIFFASFTMADALLTTPERRDVRRQGWPIWCVAIASGNIPRLARTRDAERFHQDQPWQSI
jgi:hypothetical protein